MGWVEMSRRVFLAGGAVLVAVLAVAGVLVARAGGPGEAVAGCYTGRGTAPEGGPLVATLRLRLDGHAVTGTYTAGRTAGDGLAYQVAGTLDGDRFSGTFTAAGQAVAAAGRMDARQVALDDGRGFAITRFDAGC